MTTEAFCAHCQRPVTQAWVTRGLCHCGELLNDKTVVYVEVAR